MPKLIEFIGDSVIVAHNADNENISCVWWLVQQIN